LFSNGIDEPVQIERANSAGTLTSYLPMQDTNGNVIGIADGTGKLVEKVQYDAYGQPTFIYDQEPPQVDQVRVVDGKVKIRFSEAVNEDRAKTAIKLHEGTNAISGSFVFAEEGKLTVFTPSSALQTNIQYGLEITTDLEDVSGNKLAAVFNEVFVYTGTDIMVYDRVAPQVESVKLVDGKFSIEFSEEIDPVSAANAIGLTYATGTINGTSSLEDARTILFNPASSLANATEYTIAVKATVIDLSGKALTAYSIKFTYTGKDLLIYQKPDPSEHLESAIGNNTLFQGREFDTETGLYYFRARYLHPQLGRFLQTDPVGYKDSMNLYQSFGNNPVNFVDPMGELKFKNILKGTWSFTKTVGKGALFIGGVAVVGAFSAPVAVTAGVGILAKGLIDAASNRIADNQSALQVAGGTVADFSGASGMYAGVENKDIVTGSDLQLNEEQRVEAFSTGAGQTVTILMAPKIYKTVRGSLENPGAITGASKYIPKRYRESVIKAFKGEPALKTSLEEMVVYRHWGGKASETGSPWYSIRSYIKAGNARRFLSLPETNTAENVSVFRIPKGTTYLEGIVGSKVGEAGFGKNAVGGGTQIYISDPSVAVKVE